MIELKKELISEPKINLPTQQNQGFMCKVKKQTSHFFLISNNICSLIVIYKMKVWKKTMTKNMQLVFWHVRELKLFTSAKCVHTKRSRKEEYYFLICYPSRIVESEWVISWDDSETLYIDFMSSTISSRR